MVPGPVFPPALSQDPLVIIQLVLGLRLVLMRTVIWPALLGRMAGAGLYLLYFLPCGRIGGLATMQQPVMRSATHS